MWNGKSLLLLTMLLTVFTGCIGDDDNGCFTKAVLYISVAGDQSTPCSLSDKAISGETISGEAISDEETSGVEDAMVFIFDEDSQLERVVTLTGEDIERRTPIEIMVRYGQHPQVVVWGNLNNSKDVGDIAPGMQLSSARVRMFERGGYTLPADKFYYGFGELTNEKVQEIEITNWVGCVIVTVRGVENAVNDADSYYFIIESKYDSYDFYGQPEAGNVLVKENAGSAIYQQEEVLILKPVNLVGYPANFNTEQPVIVKLYQRTPDGDRLIATADKDKDGDSIVSRIGEKTNVLLDLTDKDNVGIYIELTPWNYIFQWAWWK